MRIETLDDELVALAAFRYALGRMTYIVSSIVDFLEQNWDNLPAPSQALIHKEIQEAIDQGHAGHDCDVAQWRRLLAHPRKSTEV